jgi:hypothetical protein
VRGSFDDVKISDGHSLKSLAKERNVILTRDSRVTNFSDHDNRLRKSANQLSDAMDRLTASRARQGFHTRGTIASSCHTHEMTIPILILESRTLINWGLHPS